MVNARVTVGERLRPRPFPGPAEAQDGRSPFSGGGVADTIVVGSRMSDKQPRKVSGRRRGGRQ